MEIEKNKSVIVYGAGFWGGRNFLELAYENVHVEAFCDRDAEQIPLYYGCEVYTPGEAIEKFSELPFIVSIYNEAARNEVMDMLREAGIEAYAGLAEFYQGLNNYQIETVKCGGEASFQIVPKLFNGKTDLVAYSFGVGFDFSFELELAQKHGLQVYAFDPSPEVVENMAQQILPDNLKYYAYGLSDADTLKTFHLPSSGGRGDYSEYFASWTSGKEIKMQVHRLSTLMEKFGHKHLDLLKMDVEGSEFLALPDILSSGVSFDQLCIETHARIFPNSVEKMHWIKNLLNQHGYLLVSNEIEEQTYIHKRILDD